MDTSGANATETRPVISDVRSREAKAEEIIKRYMYWSAGAGLIPMPLIDMAAVAGVQLKMINDLSHLYDKVDVDNSFTKNKGKAIIASLIGSIAPGSMATGTFTSLLKSIPLVGTVLGSVSMSISSAAFTYAIGKVFVMHFESGGTLLDFDPEKMKVHMQTLYRKGETVAGTNPQ